MECNNWLGLGTRETVCLELRYALFLDIHDTPTQGMLSAIIWTELNVTLRKYYYQIPGALSDLVTVVSLAHAL